MKKAVFLDRDGVLNEVLTDRVKFVNHPNQLHLLDRAAEAVKLFNDSGFTVFVVTNQGGVGLGYMSESSLSRIHAKMERLISEKGGIIQEIACCTHKPDRGCSCRKPEPGMLFDLAERYGIDLSESYMIGDREPDIAAGRSAGTAVILIGDQPGLADAQFPSLWDAAEWIIAKN
ncbi:HAD-IIIA family hydrolase [Bacillus mangrovi]|uniref:D,D-heptose 1,7-bisphosphate phosphatase n=1 Tax=Metabacillus mangrovi TaxID=1491830 RepID=A0A7X2V505_9BACI|nr:HAD family hydrolase [Metabacillus mangrovi]MTH54312.1 HAD-IIIA family hydrolase [Metabacillus mangrovi]